MLSTRILRALSQPAKLASAALARRPLSQSAARLAAFAPPPTDIHQSLKQISVNDKRNYIIHSQGVTIKNLLAEKFGIPYHELLLALASQPDVWKYNSDQELRDLCLVFSSAIIKLDKIHRLDFARKIPLNVRAKAVREILYPPHQHSVMEGSNLKAFPQAARLEVFNMTGWDGTGLRINWLSVFDVLTEEQADKLAGQLGYVLEKSGCNRPEFYAPTFVNLLANMTMNQRGILLDQLSASYLQKVVTAWDDWYAEEKLLRENSADIRWDSETAFEPDENQQAALNLLREVAEDRKFEGRWRRSP